MIMLHQEEICGRRYRCRAQDEGMAPLRFATIFPTLASMICLVMIKIWRKHIVSFRGATMSSIHPMWMSLLTMLANGGKKLAMKFPNEMVKLLRGGVN